MRLRSRPEYARSTSHRARVSSHGPPPAVARASRGPERRASYAPPRTARPCQGKGGGGGGVGGLKAGGWVWDGKKDKRFAISARARGQHSRGQEESSGNEPR